MLFLAESINTKTNSMDWIKIFTLSNIADVLGILGFILTIVLLIRSEAIRKELDSQRSDYQKEKKNIRAQITAVRDNVRNDGLEINLKIISDVRTNLLSFGQKFERLLTHDDKRHMANTLKMLKLCENIDRTKLCAELDYFVARFDKKEI